MQQNATREVRPVSQYMTLEDAADALRLTPQQVRRRLNSGKLAGVKEGGRWFVDRGGVVAVAGDNPAGLSLPQFFKLSEIANRTRLPLRVLRGAIRATGIKCVNADGGPWLTEEQVDQVIASGRGDVAAPVDQNQGSGRPKTAQVQPVQAGRADEAG